MQSTFTPRLLTTLTLLGGLLVVVVPLLALSFYNHPSPADEYCFADTARHYGFWQAQKFYYDGWSGRFFPNFLVHSSPLVWGWHDGYKLYPILLLVLLFVSFFALIRQFVKGTYQTPAQLLMASAFLLLFLADLGTVSEFMYWYCGICYSLTCVLFLFLMALLLWHSRDKFRFRPGVVLVETLLVIAIVGSSEPSLVMVASLLGLLLLSQLVYHRIVPTVLIGLIGAGIVSGFFMLQAPGNLVRLHTYPQSQHFNASLIGTLKFGVSYLRLHLFRTPLLPLTLLYLPVAYQLTAGRTAARSVLAIHPLLSFAQWSATLGVLIFMHFWAVGIPPVLRLLNVINLVFLLGWFYNLTLWVRVLHNRVPIPQVSWSLVSVACAGLLTTLYKNPNVRLTYGDWLSGRAGMYSRAMDQRYQALAQSRADTVWLSPLPVSPASLVMDDIRQDPQHLWNRCMAGYYGKKNIQLRPDPTEVQVAHHRAIPHLVRQRRGVPN